MRRATVPYHGDSAVELQAWRVLVSRRNPDGFRRGRLVCSCGKPLDRFPAGRPNDDGIRGEVGLPEAVSRGVPTARVAIGPDSDGWRFSWRCKREGCRRSVTLTEERLERGRERAAADGRTDVVVGVDV
jgi:hypothetical protein